VWGRRERRGLRKQKIRENERGRRGERGWGEGGGRGGGLEQAIIHITSTDMLTTSN